MLLRGIQIGLITLYALVPAGMLVYGLWRRNRGAGTLLSLALSGIAGAVLGTGLILLNGRLLGGRVSAPEAIRLIGIAIAAICVLRLADQALMRLVFHLARVRLDGSGRPASPHRGWAVPALLAQRFLMLVITIAYGVSLVLVYRPKVQLAGDPSLLGMRYAQAAFRARDGVVLRGWWISAGAMPMAMSAEAAEQWGRRTVLLCHGIGSAKERQMGLASLLSARGYNVLAFDFRGHGQSGGNFVSYGDRERLDVLAAVNWVRHAQPSGSERIFGIGMNTGAAALLAAAAEPAEGQQIDALVLCEPFSSFDALAASTAQTVFPRGVRWMIQHVSLPLASFHAGADLRGFAPVDYAARVWPRPVLIVHGRGQSFVPFGEGMDLFRSVDQPKEQFWPSDNTHEMQQLVRNSRSDLKLVVQMFRQWLGARDSVTEDPGVQYRTLRFLRAADRAPVI